jgi:hypothetical protein
VGLVANSTLLVFASYALQEDIAHQEPTSHANLAEREHSVHHQDPHHVQSVPLEPIVDMRQVHALHVEVGML